MSQNIFNILLLLLLFTPILSTSPSPSPSSSTTSSLSFQPTGDFIFIVITTVLALRCHLLWSDSRILSKLRNRSTTQQLAAVESSDPLICFAQVYSSFSKGQHRIHNTIYEPLYFILLFGIDLFRENDDYDFDTNEYLALRVVAYVGCFTVFIARGINWKEALIACLTGVGYLIYTGMFLYGIWGVNEHFNTTRVTIERVRLVIALCHVLFDLLDFFSAVFGMDDDISGVVRAIKKCTVQSSERGIQFNNELWGTSVQNCRMKHMKELSRNPNIELVGTKRGPYWKIPCWAVFNILSLTIFALTNGFVFGYQEDLSLVPRILGIEILEMMSWAFYLLNKTQVEPSLFVHLIKLTKNFECWEDEMEQNEEEDCHHVWCARKQKPDFANLRKRMKKLWRRGISTT